MPAEKHILDQTVGDVFKTVVSEPSTVRSDGTLKDALDAMLEVPITRKVYVVNVDGVLQGTITVETLLRQAGYRLGVRATGMMSFFRFLKEVFSEDLEKFIDTPTTVTRETPLAEAARMMVDRKLNDLPVVDENDILIGELNSFEILMTGRKMFDEEPPEVEKE